MAATLLPYSLSADLEAIGRPQAAAERLPQSIIPSPSSPAAAAAADLHPARWRRLPPHHRSPLSILIHPIRPPRPPLPPIPILAITITHATPSASIPRRRRAPPPSSASSSSSCSTSNLISLDLLFSPFLSV
ncbi:hypothetical protein DAI22_07g280000 [Oryza sativa Japonica Group]|nr:hypothetical protein DAI22_07g280000 [Oryza sativa Japonica Group]